MRSDSIFCFCRKMMSNYIELSEHIYLTHCSIKEIIPFMPLGLNNKCGDNAKDKTDCTKKGGYIAGKLGGRKEIIHPKNIENSSKSCYKNTDLKDKPKVHKNEEYITAAPLLTTCG